MTAISEEAVEAAIYAFAQFGIEFRAPWQCDLDDLERERYEALCAALAAAAPHLQQGEREGWRSVPVEPTEAMHRAAWNACERGHDKIDPPEGWATYNGGVWRAMLAAVPAPDGREG